MMDSCGFVGTNDPVSCHDSTVAVARAASRIVTRAQGATKSRLGSSFGIDSSYILPPACLRYIMEVLLGHPTVIGRGPDPHPSHCPHSSPPHQGRTLDRTGQCAWRTWWRDVTLPSRLRPHAVLAFDQPARARDTVRLRGAIAAVPAWG